MIISKTMNTSENQNSSTAKFIIERGICLKEKKKGHFDSSKNNTIK